MSKKAIIIGGGVAGPVTAMALHQAGIECAVYEAYSHGAADVGAFLTFAVNGMDALAAIGVNHRIMDVGFPTPRLAFTSGTGKYLGEVALGGTLADGTVTQTIKRAALYGALQDEAEKRGVTVHYGKRLERAEQLPGGGVRVRFTDGTTDEADLLIGADGLHSVVRSQIDPNAPKPRYVPVLNTGGYAELADIDPSVWPNAQAVEPGTFHMMFGKRCFFAYSVTAGGQVWWFANPPRKTEPTRAEVEAITDAQWRAEMAELFADDRTPAIAIIDATKDELRAWATYDLPKVPVWHNDSMIVIGDAAHATSPASGQGASMAIEDAVILAKCLRDFPTTPAAFAAYEQLRRTRVERIVAAGARSSNSKAAGPIGRVIRDAVMPLFLKKMNKGGDKSAAFMFDHHIDWSAPVAV